MTGHLTMLPSGNPRPTSLEGMAVQSTMTPLGSPLPAADLADPDGRRIDLRSYAAGEPLLVVFACNHCPW